MQPYSIAPFQSPGRAVRGLLVVSGGAYLLQLMMGDWALRHFALSRGGIASGEVWQLVTYLFLHGGIMHLLFNMLGLFFFGRELETLLGGRQFVRIYLLCGVVAGLGWLALSGGGAVCLGASGAVFGIVGMYAALYPHRRVTLLVMLVLPVNLSARTLALGFMGLSLLMLLEGRGGVAHAAHLFGGLAGYGLGWLAARGKRGSGGGSFWGRLRAGRRRRGFTVVPGRHVDQDATVDADAVYPPPDAATIDAILDKITQRGIGSLTRAERQTLEQAARKRR
jgi:membrane associated rhomboid family serine protease